MFANGSDLNKTSVNDFDFRFTRNKMLIQYSFKLKIKFRNYIGWVKDISN